MAKQQTRDAQREQRIDMEIVVDAYGAQEQAMSWYCYLEENLEFPFAAKCIAVRAISPLEIGDEVEVIGMPPEAECEHEMFVTIAQGRKGLAVPLSQLEVANSVSDETLQAVEDWHYWLAQGYEFG